MKSFKYTLCLILILEMTHFKNAYGSLQINENKESGKYEIAFKKLSRKIDSNRIKRNLFYLSGELPRRVLNWSVQGHNISSLEKADLWITSQLADNDYSPMQDETRVQAFGRDYSKPKSQQYAPPADDALWYTAHNIICEKRGNKYPDDLIIILAHKDSQSWIASPGANDNAIGTCGALELAIVISQYKPAHTIRFIFCNEEHTPWTSVTAAENIKKEGKNVIVVFNLDGIGVKSPEQSGHNINITRYSSPEGEKISNLMEQLNINHKIGLEQSKHFSERLSDDDGSFIKAGFPWSVRNAGSIPNGDPNYHTEGDTPDKVDIGNAALTVKLTLDAILYIDSFGRPK